MLYEEKQLNESKYILDTHHKNVINNLKQRSIIIKNRAINKIKEKHAKDYMQIEHDSMMEYYNNLTNNLTNSSNTDAVNKISAYYEQKKNDIKKTHQIELRNLIEKIDKEDEEEITILKFK